MAVGTVNYMIIIYSGELDETNHLIVPNQDGPSLQIL